MSASLAVLPRTNETLQPDISWVKKNVPVLEVAKALGLRIRRGRAQCWRSENHTHGDADPSLCFHGRRNRARCFVCDMRGGFSNVDLVMGVLSINVGCAVAWIADRFAVPNVKPGRPVGKCGKQAQPYRVGVHGSEFEVLVKSGVFGQLTATERSILVSLQVFRDAESGITTLSYQALLRYSGIGSTASVSRALKNLQRLRAIQVYRGARIGVTRECSTYRVTLEDPAFLEKCNEVFRRTRDEVEQERLYRKQLRSARQRSRPVAATSSGSIVQGESARHLSTRTLRGTDSPAPLSERQNPPRQKSTDTCKGLNLSSPSEVTSNKPLHSVKREIEVPGGTAVAGACPQCGGTGLWVKTGGMSATFCSCKAGHALKFPRGGQGL